MSRMFMLWLSCFSREVDNASDEEVIRTGNSKVESIIMLSG